MSSSAPVERVHVGRLGTERLRALPCCARMDDVVGDAVALVLALDEAAADAGALRVVGEQVAQQEPAVRCTLCPDSVEQIEDGRDRASAAPAACEAKLAPRAADSCARSQLFHSGFTGR